MEIGIMPELFDDDYIDTVVKNLYNKCVDLDCDNCPCRNELDTLDDGSVCKADIIMELWRKWKNAKRQKHAYWIDNYPQCNYKYKIYKCSACGRWINNNPDRCPRCLAVIDVKK